MTTNIELDLYFTIIYPSFCKLSIKSMHPCKSYGVETNINTQTKTRKRAISRPKFCGWLPISNLTCILQWCKVLQSLNEINASLQKLFSGNEQQKLSRKMVITQPKFGGWLLISNLTCILQWNKVLQSLNEINASLQKLFSGNEQQKLSRKKGHN